MAVLKYSRQRESIKEYLNSSCEHPTADTVYLSVRQEFPNISLGTVYRNLNLLAEQGEIARLPMPEGPDHYDFTVKPHYHFLCKKCHNIVDVDVPYAPDFNNICPEGCTTESHILTLIGTCQNCQ